jgi:hypothetical protein
MRKRGSPFIAVALVVLGIAVVMFFFVTDARRGTSTPQPPSAATNR